MIVSGELFEVIGEMEYDKFKRMYFIYESHTPAGCGMACQWMWWVPNITWFLLSEII